MRNLKYSSKKNCVVCAKRRVCVVVLVVSYVILSLFLVSYTKNKRGLIFENDIKSSTHVVVKNHDLKTKIHKRRASRITKRHGWAYGINEDNSYVLGSLYLVNNKGCKIRKLNPFDNSIKQFIQVLPDLKCQHRSVIEVKNKTIRILPTNTKKVFCTFRSILRKTDKISVLHKLAIISRGSINVTSEFVYVLCAETPWDKKFLAQFYPFITRKPNVEERIREFRMQQKRPRRNAAKLSILMLGLELASKNQFLRHLPKTQDFIKRNLTYIELHGYNKLGNSAYANIVPMLTGMTEHELPSAKTEWADTLPLIWKEYMENGYRTMFSEDYPIDPIFSGGRKGFDKQPVDYYLRPWSNAMEPYIKKWKVGCLDHRIEANVIFKWMEDFFDFFPTDPLFGFIFLKRMSHQGFSKLRFHDKPVRDLLSRLHEKGYLNNTIVFFFGNHKRHAYYARQTYISQMEGRLPFLFLLLPSWFPEKHPHLFANLKTNERRLTTPLDIHATLKDLLYLEESSNNYGGSRKGRSISLLKGKVPQTRTCEDANIERRWCACLNLEPVTLNDRLIMHCAQNIVSKINIMTLRNGSECVEVSLLEILNATKQIVESDEHFNDDGFTNYLITIKVAPNNNIFEGSVWVDGNKHTCSVENTIERIGWYGNQSECAG